MRPDADHSPRAIAWILALSCPLLLRQSRPVLATCLTAALIVAVPDLTAFRPGCSSRPARRAVLLVRRPRGAAAGLTATLALSAAIQVHMGFAERRTSRS